MGEAQAVVLAEHRDCPLALDDERAREEAVRRGIAIIGSAGILRMAYEYCPIQTKKQLKKLLDKLAEDLCLESWLIEWVLESQKSNVSRKPTIECSTAEEGDVKSMLLDTARIGALKRRPRLNSR